MATTQNVHHFICHQTKTVTCLAPKRQKKNVYPLVSDIAARLSNLLTGSMIYPEPNQLCLLQPDPDPKWVHGRTHVQFPQNLLELGWTPLLRHDNLMNFNADFFGNLCPIQKKKPTRETQIYLHGCHLLDGCGPDQIQT